MYTKE